MTKPTKCRCPKCGAKRIFTLSLSEGFDCESTTYPKGKIYFQSDRCKLRVMTAKYRREKARMDALEDAGTLIWQIDHHGTLSWATAKNPSLEAPTLRQLADKLLGGTK